MHLASYVHIFSAAFGLSLLLKAVPTAYLILKIVGATYLLWIVIRFLTAEERSRLGILHARRCRRPRLLGRAL